LRNKFIDDLEEEPVKKKGKKKEVEDKSMD
jgi:hypothetical protein